jgi:predicted phosphodiesterase
MGKMRIAILSDIHGNSIALDAVLVDIRAQGGVDEYLILGDLAAIGYDPIGALDRIAALPHARIARGNTDRYLVTGETPAPTLDAAQVDHALLPQVIGVAKSFAWTQGAVATNGWLEWLISLRLEQRIILPDGTRLLGVHAAPGNDDGRGLSPDASDDEMQTRLRDCDADLVCVGHHHCAMDRRVGSVCVFNPGSVSNQFPPDLRASYAILDADASGYRLEHRRVEYDRAAVIAELKRVRHPTFEYIAGFMRGDHTPPRNYNR